MWKKPICLALPIYLIVFFSFAVFAGDTAEEPKERLKDLREAKAIALIEQEEEIHKIIKAAEERMARIRTDFRKAHDECLREKRSKMKALIEDCESKLKPMLKEEEELVELLGPKEASNFAKTKVERDRSK